MSLIQEALKRQQQENDGGATAESQASTMPESPVTEAMPVKVTPAPPVETSAPPPMLPPPPPGRRTLSSPWLKIGGWVVSIFIVLFIGGLLAAKWYFKTALSRTTTMAAVQPSAPPVIAETPDSHPDPAAANKEAPAEPHPVPQPPNPVDDVPVVQPDPPVSVEPVPMATESVEPETPLPPAKPALVSVPVVPEPVTWPPLKLTGILAHPGAGEGTARINNQMLVVGGQINGVTLADIRADGVVLQYGGETKFLKIGGLLY